MVQLLASGCGKTKSSWSVELSSISLCEYNIIFFLFTLDVYPLTVSTFTIISKYTCIGSPIPSFIIHFAANMARYMQPSKSSLVFLTVTL